MYKVPKHVVYRDLGGLDSVVRKPGDCFWRHPKTGIYSFICGGFRMRLLKILILIENFYFEVIFNFKNIINF